METAAGVTSRQLFSYTLSGKISWEPFLFGPFFLCRENGLDAVWEGGHRIWLI